MHVRNGNVNIHLMRIYDNPLKIIKLMAHKATHAPKGHVYTGTSTEAKPLHTLMQGKKSSHNKHSSVVHLSAVIVVPVDLLVELSAHITRVVAIL